MVWTFGQIIGNSGKLVSEPEKRKNNATKQNASLKHMMRGGDQMFNSPLVQKTL